LDPFHQHLIQFVSRRISVYASEAIDSWRMQSNVVGFTYRTMLVSKHGHTHAA